MKLRHLSLSLMLLGATGCATTQGTTTADTGADTAPIDAAPVEAAPDPSIPVAVSAEPLKPTSPLESVVLPNAKTPLVTFRLVFRTGSVDDPVGKEGLTSLTVAILREGGTATLTSAELLERLFPMAAELSASVDKELTVFHGRVHKDHLEAFLPLFTEVLTAPRFDPREFDRLKARALNGVRHSLRNEDDERLGKSALDSVLYAGHPAGHDVGGTEDGLEAITLADVQAQWKTAFTQDRLIVGLAGDVGPALADALRGSLRALAETGTARKPLPPTPVVAGRTLILERPTLSTAISMGYTWPVRRGHPDFYALAFAHSYLGEHRLSIGVLFNELREKRGLNYGDYAYVESFVQDGWSSLPATNVVRSQQLTTLWLRPVEHVHARFATRGALHFYGKLLEAPLPQQSFDVARGFVQGISRLWEQTDAQRLGWAIDGLLYGTPDHLAHYRKALETLTPAEVHAAVTRHLSPARMNFAFVTDDGDRLAKELQGQSPSPITYSTPKAPEVLAEDLQFIGAPLPIQGEIEVRPAATFMKTAP